MCRCSRLPALDDAGRLALQNGRPAMPGLITGLHALSACDPSLGTRCGLADVAAELRVLRLSPPRPLVHRAAAGDEVGQHADERDEQHDRNHRALAQPDRSGLRKMSMNTVIRIQIQITHRKKMNIVQKRFNSGLGGQ
jgi:hypothetical protein